MGNNHYLAQLGYVLPIDPVHNYAYMYDRFDVHLSAQFQLVCLPMTSLIARQLRFKKL